jgi:CheY-like chemotaxis protein
MKAMIIEEGNIVRHLLSELLFELDVQSVVEFNNGKKALDYIEHHNAERLSCIFLDINIKGTHAASFLDELMFHSVYQDIPIFILTDNHITMAVLKELNHEVCAYINKPFSMKQVRECIQISRRMERPNPFLETHAC